MLNDNELHHIFIEIVQADNGWVISSDAGTYFQTHTTLVTSEAEILPTVQALVAEWQQETRILESDITEQAEALEEEGDHGV